MSGTTSLFLLFRLEAGLQIMSSMPWSSFTRFGMALYISTSNRLSCSVRWPPIVFFSSATFMFVLKGYIVLRRRGRCVGIRKIRIGEGFCFLDGDTVWRTSGGMPCKERESVKGFFADWEFLFAFALFVRRTRSRQHRSFVCRIDRNA